jgi:predicted ATP-dependent endonuclease of OLD family
MNYIFDDRLLIGENSHLLAFYIKDGEAIFPGSSVVSFEPTKWSSGTLHIAKIIQQVILSQKVLLIDEIEQHLEPRICRKLIQYIFWLCSYGTKKPNIDNSMLTSITEKWKGWNAPLLGWTLAKKEKDCASFEEYGIRATQIFISTHSSVLIQEFLTTESLASLYEFDLKWMDNSFNPNLPFSGGSYSEKEKLDELASRKTLFTSVRYINSSANNILDNLGAKGSDLLQTNGVIWVEGPSDVIYIKKWLEMYTCENDKSSLQQGRDYEFQMFGGTLLDSLCLIHEGEDEEESYKKLVSMFSFSRNAFVVIDSDAIEKSDGEIVDKSNFFKAKKYIKEQFESLKDTREGIGLWYEEGNTEIRTMESYLDDESVDFIKPSWTKKISAQKVTENWTEDKKLSDFKGDLNGEIEKLYDAIAIWKNS